MTFAPPSVLFDLNGDGNKEIVSWPEDGGWLVNDRNGDGQITSGRELYGTQTYPGILNGWAALHQETKCGVVEPNADGLFEKLQVWVDANNDGLTDQGELRALSDFVRKLFLLFEPSGLCDQWGNRFQFKGQAVYADGEQRAMYDVMLAKQ